MNMNTPVKPRHTLPRQPPVRLSRQHPPRQPSSADFRRGLPPLPFSKTAQLPLSNYVLRCAYQSCPGTKHGRPKAESQDAWLVLPHVHGLRHQFLFAVFDGHGPYGHQVSASAQHFLQQHVVDSLQTNNPAMLLEALQEAVRKTAQSVEVAPVDTAYSGTTLTAVLINSKDLLCGNVGDSRAVLGKRVQGNWLGYELTNDHKPTVREEARRILAANGRIYPLLDSSGQPIGPERVWTAAGAGPGLAMTRSLGDRVAHTVGVVAEPELTRYTLRPEDKFLIIATDGLWDMLSSQAAVELVGAAVDSGMTDRCCTQLIQAATARAGDCVDDTSVIVVFFSAPKSVRV